MPRVIDVRVTTMEAELEFAIKSFTTGRHVFDQVVKTIGLREIWYFGLQFMNSKNYPTWLKLNKKVSSEDVIKTNPLRFTFCVKFYPEDVFEIIQNITLRLMYYQVRNDILNSVIYCPPETCVLLASYAMQVKYGDYNAEVHKEDFLQNDCLFPQCVLDQHKLSCKQWQERIVIWWMEHKNMAREDAMMEYLKITQDLEMFGVNYFEIKNKKGTELWLGVDALGINIYAKEDKLNPKTGFPWSEIGNISFNDKRFVIKPIDKKAPNFVFIAPHLRINKCILAICMGNHELYLRRRKPDTLEVQQMKAQAREEKLAKKHDRDMLLNERQAREIAVKKQREYENLIHQMQEEMETRHRELIEAQRTIGRLEEQLLEVQIAKQDMEQRQKELETLYTKLSVSKQLELAEREKLEDEVCTKQAEYERIQSVVKAKEDETKRLQKEVEEARVRQQQRQTELTFQQIQVTENEDELSCSHGEVQLNANVDSAIDDTSIEDRVTALSKKKILQDQLKQLSKDLANNKDKTKETINDRIHQANVMVGRNKYKTLREIRKGNTRRRVDYFENM